MANPQTGNPYHLFTGMRDVDLATQEIDIAISKAVKAYPNIKDAMKGFMEFVYPVLKKYRKVGAADTMSREQAYQVLVACY